MAAQTSAPLADDIDEDDAKLVGLWRSEVDRGVRGFEEWMSAAKKIEERYRAEDKSSKKSRYNVLWSNTQTMGPALYHKAPKAIVQRRYLDRDPVGRIACRILERAVQYQIDLGELHRAVRMAVQDRLLAGRGTVWLRYDPTIEQVPDDELPEGAMATPDEGQEPEDAEALERIEREVVHVDYVHKDDFVHMPARIWEEVGWVAKRAYMTGSELKTRFGEIGDDVPLNCGPDQQENATPGGAETDFDKACVWEIWDKAKRKVIWIADGFEKVLDQKDDPFGLEGFFPCPKPLYATMTNGTLVPVPDFHQYETQAEEMDDLTKRIKRIVAAIRVKGAYDGAFGELANILDEEGDNTIYPVENWANFSEKNGFSGAVDFMDINPFVKALEPLYKARDTVKEEIYEITGLSDILRGAGDPNETATGVETKGKFATLRLQDQQEQTAEFVRDIVRILAEMTCLLFQPQTLAEMASCAEMDDLQMQVPAMPPPMMPGAGQGAPLPPQHLPAMAGQ